MIRAVVFDWGGVIQRTVDPAPRRELAAALSRTPSALEAAVFESPAWEAASLGRLRADEMWVGIVRALGWPAERSDEFVERFFGGDRVDGDLVRLIRRLRAGGVSVGLLSNAPPNRPGRTSLAGRWGMDGLFDVQVFSYQVGVLKPQPAMYERVLAALNVRAAAAAMIDDAPANVAGARRVGMEGYLFRGLADLRERLAGWGLPLLGEE